MQVNAQKLSPVLLELDVEVEAERVKSELNRAYSTLARTARIRGFRPGKAPRKVLAHMFGARVAADVAQRLVDDTFPKAVSEQQVQPVNQPAIEPAKVVENQPFSYKARFEIIPQIEEVRYDGLEVERLKVAVTDEQVNEELEKLRRENSTLEPLKIERPTASGDVVTIDFAVSVDGQPVVDAGAEGFQGELGTGTLLGAIDEALRDKRVGDTAEVEVAMAEGHPHPALRGKVAKFLITLKDVKERVLPETDDEFAKDLGDYDTLEDLKKDLVSQIEKRQKDEAENRVAQALVLELVKKNPIEIPPSLVAEQMKVTEKEVLQQARQQGRVGGIPQELRDKIRADSEVKVRAGLLMAEIAKKESIKIGDPEIEEGLKELSEQTGKNLAKLRAEYRDAKKRETLVGMILENKVLDIIESKAKIEER